MVEPCGPSEPKDQSPLLLSLPGLAPPLGHTPSVPTVEVLRAPAPLPPILFEDLITERPSHLTHMLIDFLPNSKRAVGCTSFSSAQTTEVHKKL